MGGIETGYDAAQFFLLGAHTVQICTGAMLRGYEIISELEEELTKFMADHRFENLQSFVGKSLVHFTTHADLVKRQAEAKAARVGNAKDGETWKGDIAKETDSLTSNN
jgi:glutamate synthase domain-containing protein 2